ncbi:MAG: hypothetical protein LH649_14790 [Pseudanabaena sp. CAN_BIN31]|nr:hypothetical protein [Pseudanabaena sp. CAN_BIN31]
MQSDAFPTPPIYAHHFQPRLTQLDLEHQQDGDLHYLLDQIELLITDSSIEESQSFWSATDRIKIKHRVVETMQKIESLFLDLATSSTQDPDLISDVSTSLLYTNISSMSSQKHLEIPSFLKQRLS